MDSSKFAQGLAILRAKRFGFESARIGPGVLINQRDGTIDIGATTIGRGVEIAVVGSSERKAELIIGDHSSIGDRTIINATSRIVIGSNTQISWNCQILDTDFHTITFDDGSVADKSGPVLIGSNVLVGTSSIVLKNSVIGNNVVIGAGSLVAGPIESGWLAAGVPAKPIRRIRDWR